MTACLALFGCGPAPEPAPPPAATGTPAATEAATVTATASAGAADPPPPTGATGKNTRAWLLQGDEGKVSVPVSIEIPAEWSVQKVTEAVTLSVPCGLKQHLAGIWLRLEACGGKGEAECLDAHSLSPTPDRARAGEVEELGPARRFAVARVVHGATAGRIEGSAAAYDAETNHVALCSFEIFASDTAGLDAYSAACRSLVLRPAGVKAAAPAEKAATPGGFPTTNAGDHPDGAAIVEAARSFVGAAGRGDDAAANKLLLTSDACQPGTLLGGEPFTGKVCKEDVKLASSLHEAWREKVPAGFVPGAVARIMSREKDRYHVEVFGTKTPCEEPLQVIVLKLSTGMRVMPLL